MKTIGLLGGMSPESTAEYYRVINDATRRRLGGAHSAPLLIYSHDFHEIEALQRESRWDAAADLLIGAGRRLQAAGADCLLICANTMHRVASELQAAVALPLLHIADAAAEAIRARNLSTVGLLGTRYTMEQGFYRARLGNLGIESLIPEEADRERVHTVIYDELCRGIAAESSKREFLRIMGRLSERGAGGIVLGCTEIPLLIRQEDSRLPLFDTLALHALKAVDWALA